MHFSIPETVDLQEKDGSYYQVNYFYRSHNGCNENLTKHVANTLGYLTPTFLASTSLNNSDSLYIFLISYYRATTFISMAFIIAHYGTSSYVICMIS